jgi:hypothetical protein
MMMAPLEQLPAALHRRNWLILGTLLAISLPFGNGQVSAGILAGGLVAIAGFTWLQRSLQRLLAETGQEARTRYQFGYLIRLLCLGSVLAILIAIVKIHPAGLIIGLSVVVINLLWLAFQRARQ